MKRIAILICLFSSLGLTAQRSTRSVDFGIMLGGSNYMGELSDGYFSDIHFAGGLVGRYNLNDFFSLKGNAFYGRISGADSTTDRPHSQERNLSFQSEIFEFGASLEWNWFRFDPVTSNKKGFTPFMFAGLAVYKFNPKAYYEPENKWVELQPLGTEGQGTTQFQDRKKYNLTALSIPFGGGIKARISPRWTFTVEYGLRYTFNDYIDDVSLTYIEPNILRATYGGDEPSAQLADRSSAEVQANRYYDPLTFTGPERGNPKTNDWYAYGGITLTYTIAGNRVQCYKF